VQNVRKGALTQGALHIFNGIEGYCFASTSEWLSGFLTSRMEAERERQPWITVIAGSWASAVLKHRGWSLGDVADDPSVEAQGFAFLSENSLE